MNFTLCLLTLAVGAQPTSGSTHEKGIALLRTVEKSNVKTSAAGTGFLIERDGDRRWMVTCAHVVKNADGIHVGFSQTEYSTVEEVYIDESHDLALLRLKNNPPIGAKAFRI